MREHQPAKGGDGAGDARHDSERAVGKSTRSEPALATTAAKKQQPKDGLVEKLAKIGEEVLNKISDKVLGDLKELSEYSPHEADHAKRFLQHLAATCGPSSVSLQRRIEAAVDKISAYQFAKFLRKGLELSRDMASACHDLRKNIDEDGIGALFKFIGSAMGAAKSWAETVHAHAKAVHEVDDLLIRIGNRCGKKPEIELPAKIKPLVRELPRVSIELERRLADELGEHEVKLPGIQLPGHKSVIPKPILEIRGPAIVMIG